MVDEHLVQLDQREGGWTILYQDPSDGRFWELTYPESQMHGGGPPTLTELATEEVEGLYGRGPG